MKTAGKPRSATAAFGDRGVDVGQRQRRDRDQASTGAGAVIVEDLSL
jgi:hypothetical protein